MYIGFHRIQYSSFWVLCVAHNGFRRNRIKPQQCMYVWLFVCALYSLRHPAAINQVSFASYKIYICICRRIEWLYPIHFGAVIENGCVNIRRYKRIIFKALLFIIPFSASTFSIFLNNNCAPIATDTNKRWKCNHIWAGWCIHVIQSVSGLKIGSHTR